MSKRGGRTWYPSLADYDMVGSVDPDNYQIGTGRRVFTRTILARRGEPRLELERIDTEHPTLCWCQELSGHDWPGRADGEPHPR